MSTIVLIGCSKSKADHAAPAGEFYLGTGFRKALAYSRRAYPDAAIYVLSAYYGLVPIDTVLEPYDLTLNNMPANDRRAWAKKVLAQMASAGIDPTTDHFTVFAGRRYYENLGLANACYPLASLTQGESLQQLTILLNQLEK